MKILEFFKGIRTHWKKSIFAVCATAYAGNYIKNSNEISNLMRNCCLEAEAYGDNTIDANKVPKKVLVILNPAANKRSAEKNFQKYCEPILHLAGYLVNIVQTDSVGHARRYIEELEVPPDAILIAGGDGTVSEAVTGLLRRTKNDMAQCPIGILPVGRTNQTISKYINVLERGNKVEKAQGYANSALAVIRGKIEKKSILKVQPVVENIEEETEIPKPIYALCSLQWGAFKDAQNLRDKYWYYGGLRDYASTIFNAFSNTRITWNCKSKILYTPPCTGCSNCCVKIEDKVTTSRWWSRFIPKFKLGHKSIVEKIDYSKIINPNCANVMDTEINSSEITIEVQSKSPELSMLELNKTETFDSGFDFIKDNFQRINTGKIKHTKVIEGRTIELIPEKVATKEKEAFFYIDNEPYEVRPIKLAIIPNAVNLFVL